MISVLNPTDVPWRPKLVFNRIGSGVGQQMSVAANNSNEGSPSRSGIVSAPPTGKGMKGRFEGYGLVNGDWEGNQHCSSASLACLRLVDACEDRSQKA